MTGRGVGAMRAGCVRGRGGSGACGMRGQMGWERSFRRGRGWVGAVCVWGGSSSRWKLKREWERQRVRAGVGGSGSRRGAGVSVVLGGVRQSRI